MLSAFLVAISLTTSPAATDPDSAQARDEAVEQANPPPVDQTTTTGVDARPHTRRVHGRAARACVVTESACESRCGKGTEAVSCKVDCKTSSMRCNNPRGVYKSDLSQDGDIVPSR